MILRREFESYEAYVYAQGGKARGNRKRLLEILPGQVRAFSAHFVQARPWLRAGPVLCLGARSGAEMIAFERIGLKGSVGIDLHPVGAGVQVGDWHSMPEFEDGLFPNIYTNSFDHCLYLEKACAEVRRILQPGGRFYLMASDKGLKDSARAEAWARSKKHNEAIFWSRAEELRDAVTFCGFKQVKSWKNGCWSSFILEPRKSRTICTRSCAAPRRDPEQEHPGVCACGGYLVEEEIR